MILRPVDKKGLLVWLLLGGGIYALFRYTLPVAGILNVILAASLAAFLVMMIDKVQAIQGGRRLSERSLYLIALFGGSPGVVIGVYLLHHKNRKLKFKIILFMLVFLQMVIAYFLQTRLAN
ncbi:MAG: DUF1294 domain-containing protein [Parcubacteria group bacterium]|nr:DUF1294 domain-containing protein [Parcubacteria group bacterium]